MYEALALLFAGAPFLIIICCVVWAMVALHNGRQTRLFSNSARNASEMPESIELSVMSTGGNLYPTTGRASPTPSDRSVASTHTTTTLVKF